MPKRVNRAERRVELVDAYLRIVARSGVAAATTRALATEAGISSGALWHYFSDLNELVDAAFQRVYQRTNERIVYATEGKQGMDALFAMAAEVLPLSAVTRAESVIVVSLWGLLPAHEDFHVHALAAEREWSALVSRFLTEAVALHELTPTAPITDVTDALVSVLEIEQLRHVQGSSTADPHRQKTLLGHIVKPWLISDGALEKFNEATEEAGDDERARADPHRPQDRPSRA